MKIKAKRIVSIILILLFISITVTSSFAADTYVTLRYGSRGKEVAKLQQTLNNKGFPSGPVDGIYGKITEKAVINFQKANYLLVDGIAGKQTQSALYSQPVSRGGLSSIRSNYTSEDLYWMSRIIHAEAEAEPYTGKIAVGNVVLNRVKSSSFPNTVKGVIFEYYRGIPQFSPVADGTIYNNPSSASIQAAKDAFNGVNIVGSSTYFFNPDKAAGSWIVNNKIYVTKIGNHAFYR